MFVCVGETNNRRKVITTSDSNLATEVDDSSVWVEEWQKDSAAGVQFLQGQWLSEVLLLNEIQMHPQSYMFDYIQCDMFVWKRPPQQTAGKPRIHLIEIHVGYFRATTPSVLQAGRCVTAAL